MANATVKDKPAAAAQPELKVESTENVPAVIKRSAVQGFIDSVFDGDRAKQVIDSLGDAVTFAKFRASVATAIMNSPELLNCQPPLVFREVARVAALGLVFDHHLGEAYMFASWDGKTKKKDKPQVRVGYRGLMKLARNESDVMIYAHEVRENDEFECVLGLEKTLTHKHPSKFAPRGDVIGYYAVAKFREAHDVDFEPMSNADVLAIRDRTEGWKAFKAGKISSAGPWSTDEVEMGKKTVIRRLWKRLPSGPKMSAAIRIEDDAEAIIQQPASTALTQSNKQGASEALDRFAAKPRGVVTDVPPEEDFGTGDPRDGEEEEAAVEAKPEPAGTVEQKAEAPAETKVKPPVEVYTEEEESPAKVEAKAAIPFPQMPEEAQKAWLLDSNFMPGWKWISMVMVDLEDADARTALANEHVGLLSGVANKSTGYRDAVKRFLESYAASVQLESAPEKGK